MIEYKNRVPNSAGRNESPWEFKPSDMLSERELIAPPAPIEWALPPYFPLSCASALTAAGGSSKTGLMILAAVNICLGRSLLGEQVQEGKVVYLSAEDNRDALLRHIYANTRDLSSAEIRQFREHFYLKDLVGVGSKLTRRIDGRTAVGQDVASIIEYVEAIGPVRMLVFDTLCRFNGGEESNDDLARVVEAMERISTSTGASTVIVHHTGKAQARSDIADQYSGRGGSSLSDNCRSVVHVAVMKSNDSNIPSNARELAADGRLLRISHVKSNYASCAKDRYIERVHGDYAATLRPFHPEYATQSDSDVWQKLCDAISCQGVTHPTKSSFERVASKLGIPRAAVRNALTWAVDSKCAEELKHPNPAGGRKTYFRCVSGSNQET